ncbi:MAG TPA: hypothetical protein VGE74_13165 [Gemmata sp.]
MLKRIVRAYLRLRFGVTHRYGLMPPLPVWELRDHNVSWLRRLVIFARQGAWNWHARLKLWAFPPLTKQQLAVFFGEPTKAKEMP